MKQPLVIDTHSQSVFVIPAKAGIPAAAEQRDTRVPRVREGGDDERGRF